MNESPALAACRTASNRGWHAQRRLALRMHGKTTDCPPTKRRSPSPPCSHATRSLAQRRLLGTTTTAVRRPSVGRDLQEEGEPNPSSRSPFPPAGMKTRVVCLLLLDILAWLGSTRTHALQQRRGARFPAHTRATRPLLGPHLLANLIGRARASEPRLAAHPQPSPPPRSHRTNARGKQ